MRKTIGYSGEKTADHFPDVRKTMPMPKGAEKEMVDIILTRYAYPTGYNTRKPASRRRCEKTSTETGNGREEAG